MSQTLASGIKKYDPSDNVTRQSFNDNFDVLDQKLRTYREEVDTSTKDAAAGVYTVVNYKRPNNSTLYMKATLSNKVSGYYTTDTWQFYDDAGTTVIDTITWTLTYDTDGIVTTKVPSK